MAEIQTYIRPPTRSRERKREGEEKEDLLGFKSRRNRAARRENPQDNHNINNNNNNKTSDITTTTTKTITAKARKLIREGDDEINGRFRCGENKAGYKSCVGGQKQ